MAALVAGMALGPAGDRTGDAGGLAGIGLGMEAVQKTVAATLLPLPGAGPGHIEAVARNGAGRSAGRTGLTSTGRRDGSGAGGIGG